MFNYSRLDLSTKIIIKVLAVVLGLWFLWIVRDILLILLFAIVLASAMEPLVDYLKVRKIPRVLTVLVVYILVIGTFSYVIFLVTPPVISQAKLAIAHLPEYVSYIQKQFPLLANVHIGDVADHFLSGDQDNSFVNRTIGVFSGLVSFLTILVISFYLVAEDRGMKKFVSSLVPEHSQDTALRLVQRIQSKMGLWVLGQLLLSLSIFVATFIGLSVLGVEYALFLALLAGCFEIIPFVGPTLSAIPAIFIGFTQSPALGLAVLVLYVLVQKLESWILVPKIMQKTVGTSPLVVILALLIGIKLGGIIGLLLAVPLVGVFTVLREEWKS